MGRMISNSRKPQRAAQPLRSLASTARRGSTPSEDDDDVRRGLPSLSEGGIEHYRPTELPTDPRQRAQLLREFGTRAGAYHKTKLAWGEAQQRHGDPQQVKAVRRLTRNWTRPMAALIESEAWRLLGRRGPKDRWHSAYELLGAETLAHETVIAVLSLLMSRTGGNAQDRKLVSTDIARAIGSRISLAARLKVWQKVSPALFSAYERGLDKAGATPRHREKVLTHGLNAKARNAAAASTSPELQRDLEPWTEAESSAIGVWLLWRAVTATKGAISLKRRLTRKGKARAGYYDVVLSPRAVAWLNAAVEVSALRATSNRAMICPPRPWKGPRGGGYLLGDDLRFEDTHLVRAIPPVRQAIEEALASDNATQAAQPVFAALNVLQETRFAINETVHDIALQAANAELKLDDLPASYRLERVPKAPPTGDSEAEDKARHTEWRRKQAEVENRNARNIPKALWSQSVLAEAAELRELEREGADSTRAGEQSCGQVGNGPLWFVHLVDFRGRMYPAGTAINPQGSDLARSLLRFATGKPIDDGRGPYWLAAQVAKAFGHDKVSWDERVSWTEAHEDLIRRIANDPLGNRQLWEHESDKLWAALAAAREWTAYLDSGRSPSFITTLPIFIDGTCNGLQHYAALSGDPELARLVNLEPGELPQDIYREVAAEALRDLRMRSERGAMSDRRAAHLWLRIIGDEPPRKLAKKIVMTKPYGAGFHMILDEVRDFFDENERKQRDEWGGSVEDDELPKLRGWLAKRMEAALKGRTASADRIMEWLQQVMRLLCDHGVADKLDWRSPAGFPWKNLYFGHSKQKVKLTVDGKQQSVTLAENDTSKFNHKDAGSAIAPNFVHGLDAAAMMFATCAARGRGVADMMAIHDCVGGLACDMDVIAETVRVGFVKCHEARPLERFREAVLMALPDEEARVKLSLLPPRGEFDARRVLGSGYFFC